MVFGFNKKNDTPVDSGVPDAGINVYLGSGTTFEGRLEFTGTAQISGVFKGEIVSQGTLVVGQGGTVEGEFKVGQFMAAGQVNGEIVCSRKAVLQKNAQCSGLIRTPLLEVEDGANFEGHITMSRKPDGSSPS